MSLYKYETHLHTSEASACGAATGAEMARAYKEAGYAGIIVTDHFFNGHTSVDRRLPWKEKVRRFCRGYENAKKHGERIGLSVFFGWEYAYEGSEFLTYGLDGDWLAEHPEVMDMPVYDYIKFARLNGGYVVQAHPFRQELYIKKFTLLPEITDAVEVYNARNRFLECDLRAEWYADSYNLPKTSGSDAHNADYLDGFGVASSYKFNDIHDYISAVENRELKLIRLPTAR
ncbi:MAG: PHP domain-containing protein [Oscillospiraceae bacterium]|nr:PHP domain-containing protein [Oscillospiraceae bacterium]